MVSTKLKRAAITIIYEGLHHLLHNDFALTMAKNFDYWVVVEGLSGNGGSGRHCNMLELSRNSTDGTIEFMTLMSKKFKNVIFYTNGENWKSKDDQVNKAIELLQTKISNAYLWQVDADEQWTLSSIEQAETSLALSNAAAASFQFNHMLCKDSSGRQLMARGNWGSDYVVRLWHWSGEKFISHAPPVLEGQSDVIRLPQKFDHYSYSFRKDVLFKSRYYKGYRRILPRWDRLSRSTHSYPIPVSYLLGAMKGSKNSYIYAT